MVELKNLSAYWLDENTFCIGFDGGSENGNEYDYSCEYWIKENEFRFVKCFDYEYECEANFTDEEKIYIEKLMRRYMEIYKYKE